MRKVKRVLLFLFVISAAILLMGQSGKRVVSISTFPGIQGGEGVQSGLVISDLNNFDPIVNGRKLALEQRKTFGEWPGTELTNGPNLGLVEARIIGNRGTRHTVVVAEQAGDIQTNTGSGAWSSITGTSSTGPETLGLCVTMLEFMDSVIVTGGELDSIYVLGGDPLAWQYTYDWSYPLLALHRDRIYAAGFISAQDTTANKLIWRPEFDLEFDSVDTKFNSGFVYIGRDDGDYITAIAPLGNDLIVYKRSSIYRVVINPTTNDPVEVIQVSNSIGCIHVASVGIGDGEHFFPGQDGIYRFNGRLQKISGSLDRFWRDSIDRSHAWNMKSRPVLFSGKLYVPVFISATQPRTRLLVYDLTTHVWTKYTANYSFPNYAPLIHYQYNAASTALNISSASVETEYGFIGWAYFNGGVTDRYRFLVFPEFGQTQDGASPVDIYSEINFTKYGGSSILDRKYIGDVGFYAENATTGKTLNFTWSGYPDTLTQGISLGTDTSLYTFRAPDNAIGGAIGLKVWTSAEGDLRLYFIDLATQVRGKSDAAE